MVFNLVIPNPKNMTVKDVIIKELSVSKGSTVLKLLNSCKKNNLNVSYHAVYQAINELRNYGVLEKLGDEYVISKKYIDSLKEFTRIIEENQSEKVNLNLQPYTTKHLTFNSLNEATLFMAKAAYSNVFDILINREVYIISQHLWLTQTIKGVKSMALVKKIVKLNNWYGLIQGKSLADKKLKEYYEKEFGAKIKIGISCASLGNTVVFGDYISQTFIPKKLIEYQNKVFSNCKDEFSLEWIEEYTKLCYFDKYRIHVTISRNKELADEIKENIMKHFK